MYTANYARYRAPDVGGDVAPPMAMGNGGSASSGMMPPAPVGRPRGVPGGASAMRGGGGYGGSMPMSMDVAPEDVAKSLQPLDSRYGMRRPRGPIGAGRGGDSWNPSTDYALNSMSGGGYGGGYAPQAPSPRPMGRPPQQGDGYGPPTKYRRTSDYDEFEDPRNGGGGRGSGGRGSRGGGPRGPPSPADYRGHAGGYDMPMRGGAVNGGRGGSAGYAPQSQPQFRPPPQRAGYASYAPPSPHTPRTQQEMMMMRRRLMEQERDGFAPVEPMGYRGGPMSPAVPSPNGGGAPSSMMSSAAAAWARELDPYDNARRIHRELQPPVNGGARGGRGSSPMTPQASAQMRMQREATGRYDNSPGSRIVTPAATLHSSQRAGEWVAPRRNPMASNARIVDTGQTHPPQQQPAQFADDELEPMPLGNLPNGGPMSRGRNTRGPVNLGDRSLPPAVTAQLSMQEYEAMMMMERELTAPPVQDQRRMGPTNGSRPTSATSNGRTRGRADGVSPGRGMAMAPPDTKFDAQSYMMQQKDEYAMPPPAPVAEAPLPAPKRVRQPKTPIETSAAPPQTSSKKRKESAATKRKARDAAEDMMLMAGGDGFEETGMAQAKAASTNATSAEPKRRCGRKSMNYSSEQKRERNRAAVKKCRQRQALKYDYLKRKAEVLASENRALSEMLVKNVELDDEKRNSLTRGIQMDILLKIKEIFTQSLPKDFVLDADSIWDLNSVLAVSMPSRCYYGIESIKDFWRTSLRMRNKGKIRSFWAWLFRLPPGDRFAEFTITPFSPTSNLYFINWTTKSTPALSGSIVIMFGHGHRVTLHVEIFGWLIWRYLLTNTPFPEPPLE